MCKALFVIGLFLTAGLGAAKAGCPDSMENFRLAGAAVSRDEYTKALLAIIRYLAIEKRVLPPDEIEQLEKSEYDLEALEFAAGRIPSTQYLQAIRAAIKGLAAAKVAGATADTRELGPELKILKEKLGETGIQSGRARLETRGVFATIAGEIITPDATGLKVFSWSGGNFVVVTHDALGLYIIEPKSGAKTKINDRWVEVRFFESLSGKAYLAFNSESSLKIVDALTAIPVMDLGEKAFAEYSLPFEIKKFKIDPYETDEGHLGALIQYAGRVFLYDTVKKNLTEHPYLESGVSELYTAQGKVWIGKFDADPASKPFEEVLLYELPSGNLRLKAGSKIKTSLRLPVIYRTKAGKYLAAAWGREGALIHNLSDGNKTSLADDFEPLEGRDHFTEGPDGQIYFVHPDRRRSAEVTVFTVGSPEKTKSFDGFPIEAQIQAQLLFHSSGKKYLFVYSGNIAGESKKQIFVVDLDSGMRIPVNLGGLDQPWIMGFYEGESRAIFAYVGTSHGLRRVQLYGEVPP
jgi:hypothetical protein